MFCQNCGKEIRDGVKFCPHCGNKVSNGTSLANNENKENEGFLSPEQDTVKNIGKSLNKEIEEGEKVQQEENQEKIEPMDGMKAVVALIIGYVLSFITFLLVVKWSFFSFMLLVLFFVVIFCLLSRFGPLIGVFGGGVGAFLVLEFIGKWAEATDGSGSWFMAFLFLTPLAVIYAIILYFVDKMATDKKGTESDEETKANEENES